MFRNREGFKVEGIGNLGITRNVYLLDKLTNIIISIHRLLILGFEPKFRKYSYPAKMRNTEFAKVIYGILAAGVY